jgi:hypothetical protein
MLVKIAVGFLAAFLGVFSACTIGVLQAGIGTVYIKNEDLTLWLPIPMAAADVGLWFIPEKDLMDIRTELAPVKALVLTGFHLLQDLPDSTLVEVKTIDESVFVVKEGNDLIVDVDSRTEGRIHVELPLHSLERILRKVGG